MTVQPLPAGQESPPAKTGAVPTHKPRIGPVPFSALLAVSVGILVLLAVMAVLAIQWRASIQNTFSLLNEQAVLIIERIESGIDDHLEPAAELADFVAHRVENGALDLENREAMIAELHGTLAGSPQIQAVILVFSDWRRLGVAREDDAKTRLIDTPVSPDPEIRAAMAELTVAEEAFWGEPLYTSGRETIINLRQPLRRNGAFIGVLVVAITVPALSEIVTQAGDLFGATAFILYGRDEVLAHPYLISAQPGLSEDNPLVERDRVGDLVLGSIWEAQPVPGFEGAAGENVEVLGLDLGDREYVFIYKWLEDYGKVPWALGTWVPATDVNAEMRRLALSGAAGLTVLLLAIVAAVLLGRFVAKPIIRVAASAAKVGDLELENVERLPASGIRELNEQARAFNAMLAGLQSFETYVPRNLVTRLIRQEGEPRVRSRERDLTILFTDIVGFTPMCEGMSAGQVADFLNEHFAMLGACVEAEGGTVDKFIGDALMAFWGAPDKQKGRALRACRAALAMAETLESDNARRTGAGLPPIRIRVGIHTGPVVVGNIGWPGRINYTIVGDTVNTAQRLEMLGKEMDRGDAATILISGETAERLDDAFRIERVGSFEIKGKAEAVEVYRLLPAQTVPPRAC